MRRNFNPYTDIDWDSPEFAVVDNDERWILPATDPRRPAPLVPGAVARAADRDRHVATGQRRQGRPALRVDPDPRPDGVRVLDAQRLAGVPVLPARGGRRVQPHHDVPGDGEPHRRRRAGHAAAAEVGPAGHSAGRRAAADPVLVRHPRRRGAHRPHAEERAARGQDAAPDHGAGDGDPRRRGGAAHLVRARVPAQAGAAPAAAQAVLVVALRPADHADPVLGHHRSAAGRSGRNSTSRARSARRSSSGRPSPGRCCATCSATSGCSATTPA